jgi:taurine transport system substrate-binding protein
MTPHTTHTGTTIRHGLAAALAAGILASTAACGAMPTASQMAGNASSSSSSGACPVGVNKDASGTIRIGWQAIPNADLIVKDKGYLEACLPNATIQWNQFNSGADVVQAFGSGSIDIAQMGSSPSVKAVSAPLDLDVKIVWIHDVIGEAESLVSRDSSVTSIKDLRGKNIATPFGSTSHFSLLSALDQAGMSAGDVNLINLDPDKMAAAWTRGEIDAAWVWDPVLSTLKADGGTVVTSSAETAKEGAATYDMEVATSTFATDQASALKTWTAVEDYAVHQIASDPDGSAESIAAQMGNKAADVKTQFAGYEYPDAAKQSKIFSKELPSVFESTGKFLTAQGSIDEANKDYSTALHSDAIDAVASTTAKG